MAYEWNAVFDELKLHAMWIHWAIFSSSHIRIYSGLNNWYGSIFFSFCWKVFIIISLTNGQTNGMTIVVHKNSSRIHSGLFVIEGVPAPFNDYFFLWRSFFGTVERKKLRNIRRQSESGSQHIMLIWAHDRSANRVFWDCFINWPKFLHQ